mgnify:FL=1
MPDKVALIDKKQVSNTPGISTLEIERLTQKLPVPTLPLWSIIPFNTALTSVIEVAVSVVTTGGATVMKLNISP